MISNKTKSKPTSAITTPIEIVSEKGYGVPQKLNTSLEDAMDGAYHQFKKNFVTPIVEDIEAFQKTTKTIKKEDVEEGYQLLASILFFIIFSFVLFKIAGDLRIATLLGAGIAIASHFMESEDKIASKKQDKSKK